MDKLDYKPHEKSFTLKELIEHILGGEYGFAIGVITGDWERKAKIDTSSVEGMLKALEDNHQKTLKAIEPLSDDELASKDITTPWGAKAKLGTMLFEASEHTAHHRTQLFWYLKLLDIPVDTGTIYG